VSSERHRQRKDRRLSGFITLTFQMQFADYGP
jgi:hypothetical protein